MVPFVHLPGDLERGGLGDDGPAAQRAASRVLVGAPHQLPHDVLALREERLEAVACDDDDIRLEHSLEVPWRLRRSKAPGTSPGWARSEVRRDDVPPRPSPGKTLLSGPFAGRWRSAPSAKTEMSGRTGVAERPERSRSALSARGAGRAVSRGAGTARPAGGGGPDSPGEELGRRGCCKASPDRVRGQEMPGGISRGAGNGRLFVTKTKMH